MITEKVRHRSTPAEPFARPGAHGRITRTHTDGPLRVTPAHRGIPAMAHVEWPLDDEASYFTWERLADLIFQKGRR
jgi:hypothetical protein